MNDKIKRLMFLQAQISENSNELELQENLEVKVALRELADLLEAREKAEPAAYIDQSGPVNRLKWYPNSDGNHIKLYAEPPKQYKCSTCPDSGIVGRAPDDYWHCPDCLGATQGQASVIDEVEPYDAGLLGDFGGGNVEWWQDYIRSELQRAHEFYESQLQSRAKPGQTTDKACSTVVPDEKLLNLVAVTLFAAGWRDTCDAQWTGLKKYLPELAAMLKGEK